MFTYKTADYKFLKTKKNEKRMKHLRRLKNYVNEKLQDL